MFVGLEAGPFLPVPYPDVGVVAAQLGRGNGRFPDPRGEEHGTVFSHEVLEKAYLFGDDGRLREHHGVHRDIAGRSRFERILNVGQIERTLRMELEEPE